MREAFRPAAHPGLEGWVVRGPSGTIAERLVAAVTPFERVRGLLGRRELGPGEAMLIQPCSRVHTFGMRFPIDAVFCDAHLHVLWAETLEPGHVSRHVRRARCCFELPAGTAERAGLAPGSALELVRPAMSR